MESTRQIVGTYEYSRESDRLPVCWNYPDNACYSHFHSNLEIVYVRAGSMQATLGGQPVLVRAGQVVLVPSYMDHQFSTETSSDTIILIVPLDYIPSIKQVLHKKRFSRLVLSDDHQPSELLYALERLASGRFDPEHPVYRGFVQVVIGLIIDQAGLREADEDTPGELVRAILVYLQESYRQRLDLPTLSRHFGYSNSRFSHIFNERFQMSITSYVNSLRCRHAASLLLDGVPQLDAALQAGFETIRTFYRAFRTYYQETPSQFCARQGDKKLPVSRLSAEPGVSHRVLSVYNLKTGQPSQA